MEGIDPQSENPVDNPCQSDSVDNLVHSSTNKTEVNELEQSCAEIKPAAGASTAEERCPICLEDFEDKAFIDACFHTFCFECIVRWSETTITSCPMCKTGFNKIIHNVRANDDYDVFKVVPKPSHPSASEEVVDLEEALRSFRGYRTTRFSGPPSHSQPSTSTGGGGLADRMASRSHLSTSGRGIRVRGRRRESRKPAVIERRRAVYSTRLRALPLLRDRKPVRVRDVSAAFFLANPASTHRLYPWLNRELTVLLGDEHVQFVIQIILSLLDKVDMKCAEFASHLEPYLHEKTSHFMHEFLSFASSPYDMIAYDKNVSYDWPADPAAPSHNLLREGIDITDSMFTQGTSVDMQQRIFDEITSTRWEDSPPIVETLSPSYVDHSSGSEIEVLQEEDQKVCQDQSGEHTTITRDQTIHGVPDQIVDTETVNESQVNSDMLTSTDDNRESIAEIQFVDLTNDNTCPRGPETTLACIQNSGRARVEASEVDQRPTVNKIETEPVISEFLPQTGISQSQTLTSTEYVVSDPLENTIPTDDKGPGNEDSTDYEINVYVENEDDPSNQRGVVGDMEGLEETKVKHKTKGKDEESETGSRLHPGNTVALANDKMDTRKKQTEDCPSNTKRTKPSSHSTVHRNRDNRKSARRKCRQIVSTDSGRSLSSGRDVHRYKHQYRKDKHKQREKGHERKRYRDERLWSDSDSYSSSDADRHKRHRYRRDISRERKCRDSSHSRYRRDRSVSRGRPSNHGNDELSPPTSRKNKVQTRNQDSRGSRRKRGSRSCSRSRSNSQGHSRHSRSRVSTFYQREKGHRSRLYSDEYPDKAHSHIEDNVPQSHLSERVRTEHRETKKHKSKETHRESVKHRVSTDKGHSIQAQTCVEFGTDKSQCELTVELSGLEEEIRDNKRDLLKSMLRRERIELLRKNLYDLGADASVRYENKEQQKQSYMLDCANPVEVGRRTSSTSDMQKELVCLEQAIVDGKKQLLRVMMKMEEDQVEQETGDESA